MYIINYNSCACLGKNWTTKVEETRQQLQKAKANATIITALDEIAWLLNIRGRDIPCNPFVRSYLILTMQKVTLYVNASQLIEHNVMKHLNSDYGVSSYSVMYVQQKTKIIIKRQIFAF